MGCFSFLCADSGKAALSTSFNGSPVYMFLLKGGKVIEEMFGNYNSYGAVFTTELDKSVNHELYDSFEWKMDWSDICGLMFNSNPGDGIAVVLEEYYKGVHPTTQSEGDPNQGWGEHDELLGDVGDGGFKRVENPYHKVY